MLNLEILESYSLTPNDFVALYLLSIEKKITFVVDFIRLEKLGFVKITEEGPAIRAKGLKLIQNSLPAEDSSIESWIQDYRTIFKGVKPGSMGDKLACKEKMERFMDTYPEYTKEDILRAAKYYIDSCRPADKRFLRKADYFIFKMNTVTREEVSDLATILEEIQDVNTEKDTASNNFIQDI